MELIKYVRDTRFLDVLDTEERIVRKGKSGRKVKVSTWVKVSKGDPYAMVISNGWGSVGWSMCYPGDRFDKHEGLMVARIHEEQKTPPPPSLYQEYERMKERSLRAYKN